MDVILICLAFAAFSIGVILIREIFLWLRNRIPRTVQCWFCHSKTVIPYIESNSWFCSSCDQYNGFTKDGDYNKVIDKQYEEKLNFTVSSFGRSKSAWKSNNSLCDSCNHNQELKVQQLASFVPLDERNYDLEVDHYRAQLEKCYKLCSSCENLLSKIFANERTLFSIPRRLASSLIIKAEFTGIARFILYVNLLVSLIVSISAYIKLEGVPPFIAAYLNEYHGFHVPLNVLKPSYLLILGLAVNILGWFNIRSYGLLLNSLSWLIVLGLTSFPNGFKHYIIGLQALSGIISCGVSVICLSSKRSKSKKSSRSVYDGKKFNTSFGSVNSSSVETTPSENSQFTSKTSKKTTNNWIKTSPGKTPTNYFMKPPQKNSTEAINTGLRGLNIGYADANSISSRNFTTYRQGNLSADSGWWANNGGIYGNNVLKQRRCNSQQNTGLKSNHLRPPSSSSSGFSEIAEDLVDDCNSCTGNSPVCRHSCHFNPAAQVECSYYAAAYFQRLLFSSSAPPSSPKSIFTNNHIVQEQTKPAQISADPVLAFMYSLPVIALIVSNVALLWTVYCNHAIPRQQS